MQYSFFPHGSTQLFGVRSTKQNGRDGRRKEGGGNKKKKKAKNNNYHHHHHRNHAVPQVPGLSPLTIPKEKAVDHFRLLFTNRHNTGRYPHRRESSKLGKMPSRVKSSHPCLVFLPSDAQGTIMIRYSQDQAQPAPPQACTPTHPQAKTSSLRSRGKKMMMQARSNFGTDRLDMVYASLVWHWWDKDG
ncbi:hypothetical protein B9Z19DRAFT_772213 [Tuber borchii]|uniref:Uncharacterized protein n=1 Tax=Tuber borchii TaxID=42251 RepID=A0A2T6ZWT1_TUBBO|nr:hypothetical protein B9Z19DRAFT_772213 [Tuber borchii]